MITVGFIAVADIGLLELAGLISLLYGSYGITLVKKKAKNKKMREIIKKKLALLAVTMGKAQSLENQQALQAQIAAPLA